MLKNTYRLSLLFAALIAAAALMSGCNRQQSNVWTSADEKSFRQFSEAVIPLLEARCGVSCHGIPQDQYQAWMNNPANVRFFFFPVEPGSGRMAADAALRRMAFDVARGKWRPPAQAPDSHDEAVLRIDYQAAPEYSPLLRAPLAEILGGDGTHRGTDVFYDLNDPGYRALRDWVALEIGHHPEAAPEPVPAAQFFRDRVVDVLERKGCFTASCHGANAFNDLKLQKPLPRLQHQAGMQPPARLSPRMLAENRRQLLGSVTRFVNIGGDLKLSRALVKNLPLREGGVHQRGGNNQFFENMGDPDAQTLLQWMQLEKEDFARRITSGGTSIPAAELGREQGIAFLRGPRHAPRRYWEFDAFHPGTKLLILPAGATDPISIVDEPGAEIQALDVRYDARAILFSMRRAADQGFRLYQIELGPDLHPKAGSLRQISSGPARTADGTLIHHIDPVYLPEWTASGDASLDAALDRVSIAYASNAAGTFAQSEQWAILGEADASASQPGLIVDARRSEAAGTYSGRRLHVISGPLQGASRTIRRHDAGGRFVLDRPLPQAPDARSVFAIEQMTPRFSSAYDIWWAMPDRFEQSARRIVFSNAQERRPTVRSSGEVMFTSVRNRGWMAGKPVFNGAIFRAQAGGWDYHVQGGNRSGYPLYADARELPSGLEIRMAMDPRNLWGGGAPVLADHGLGVHLEPGNPVDDQRYTGGASLPATGYTRYLPPQVELFPARGAQAVTATGISPGGSFRDPYPLADGSVLVAHSAQPFDHLNPDADPDWDIYRLRWAGNQLQSEDGQHAGPVQLERIAAASTPGMAEFNPRPLVVRPKEKSVTHQKFALRTDGRKPQPVDGVLRLAQGLPAEIECYDFPLLQSFLENDVPVGARNFRDSQLRFVRIVRQIPSGKADILQVAQSGSDADPFARPIASGIHERAEIVAEVPLEADGSFYVEVPSEVPLLMQGLNAERMAIISMNRWFYLQPGEKLTFSIPRKAFSTRCAGCHGALTGDKADATGPVDATTSASIVMANWNGREHARHKPFRGSPLSVDFAATVQPILDRRCVSCHGGKRAAAGLDLRGTREGAWSVAYHSLQRLEQPGSGNFAAKRYVDEREALSSKSLLIEKLTGRKYAAPQRLDTPGKIHVPELTEAELLTLVRWIDLGATFHGGHP